MKNRGFTLTEILIVVAVISLLATILVPNLIRVRIQANESTTKSNLRTIAHALENYVTENNVYPLNVSDLINTNPPYLPKDFFNGTHQGFSYTADVTQTGYWIIAEPCSINHGSQSFTIATGAVFNTGLTD